MDDLIVGLLRHRGAVLESNPLAIGTPSIRPLGRISEPPIGLNNGPARLHTNVWHAPDGWTILDRVELDRWIVDAIVGQHWILSERPLSQNLRLPEKLGVEIEIWGPDQLSNWLGEAILSGEVNASVSSLNDIDERRESRDVEEIRLESAWFESIKDDLCTMSPMVNLESWIERNPIGNNVRPTAVLVEARIWSVLGMLRGPESNTERAWWGILESPIFETFEILQDPVFLSHRPDLRVIPPLTWMDENIVLENISRVTETRKTFSPDSLSSVRIHGTWSLDPSSTEVESVTVLVPAWIMEIPNSSNNILNAVTGNLHPFTGTIR
ncbi:MAG: hypothetical protein CMB31_02210 [Euryarchaeota archaeon]|nr:hypothetical protein [Euryarchaeota archaeon]